MIRKHLMGFISALICIACIMGSCILPVSATPPVETYFEGSDGVGAVMLDEALPLLIERVDLTFELNGMPNSGYGSVEDYLAYMGKVTTEYTFYNPSDSAVTAKLTAPYLSPSYAPGYDKSGNRVINGDNRKYEITVKGDAVEKNLRHTYRNGDFVIENELSKLCDAYAQDGFYYPEMTVTEYIFEINTHVGSGKQVAFDIDADDSERRVYLANRDVWREQGNGEIRLSALADDGKTVKVYVVGKDYEAFPEWSFYKDYNLYDGEETQGEMSLLVKNTMTLEEYILSKRSDVSAVSDVDWYNATLTMLNTDGAYYGNSAILSWNDIESYLDAWYEYEITVNAGERVTNTVTAPMYPSINEEFDPQKCDYTYILTNQSNFSENVSIRVTVNTPYYVLDCNIKDYEITDRGFTATLDGEARELKFTLCESAEPEPVSHAEDVFLVILLLLLVIGVVAMYVIPGIAAALTVAFIIVSIIAFLLTVPILTAAVIVGVVILIIFLCKRKKRK